MKKIFNILLIAILFASCSKTPEAAFTYEKATGMFGGTIEGSYVFHNKSQNADYYEWDFGDGSVSTEKDPTHTYKATGNYTVTLKAYEKKHNNCGTFSEQIAVSLNGENPGDGTTPPTANFSFTGSNQYAPATMNFTNLSQNASSYSWDFGDGSTSSSQNPSHTYSTPGTYSVTLQATNNIGSDVITKTVNVKQDPTKWNLTRFVLTAYPETDDGDNWDYTDAGPDIYFQILNGSTVIYTSSTKDDVSSNSLPLTWTVSDVSLDVNTQYTIKFYDEDGALDSDDLMGTITFKPNILDFNSSSWSWTSGSWSGIWDYNWN